MTQEEKELLLKDLCARLPYRVKVHTPSKPICTIFSKPTINSTIVINGAGEEQCCIKDIKPYLFPLSSMTKEQWDNAPSVNLTEFTFDSLKCGCFTISSYTCENDLHYLLDFINWLIENHFDIYGLIPKGLAIDATGKNIY